MFDVKAQAIKELGEEEFRMRVDKIKTQLREKRYWFPWRFQIINLNKERDNECK